MARIHYSRVGDQFVITIPKAIARFIGLKGGEEYDVIKSGDQDLLLKRRY